MTGVPKVRIRALRPGPTRPERQFVLYWMTSFRRTRFNFAFDRAVEHARNLHKPLVVFEALRLGYAHASERHHTFILQGMADNQRQLEGTTAHYFPFVETTPNEGRGLLAALAHRACVIVGDDWPCFFVPKMQAAAAKAVDVLFEVVDSNGLYPMHDTERVFTTAHSFRTHLQKVLPAHLMATPRPDAMSRVTLPTLGEWPKALSKWPPASPALLQASPSAVAALPIDHVVKAVGVIGGGTAAETRLKRFAAKMLRDYDTTRNEPEVDGTSALSPWLHFGHVSSHEVFARVVEAQGWTIDRLGASIGGAKQGWWKMSSSAEAFLDQLVTWRELAFNMSSHCPDTYDSLQSLPAFARETISRHANDTRVHLYSLENLEFGKTHDRLWNAAMGQLRHEGWFHNYLRMLWGKKIYEWSVSAEVALKTMDHLMSKYSLDGRDPVSWSGALWVLGRYDRAWGPERSIFGKLRYMSSDNTQRKLSVQRYMDRWA
jgi:deoxyribodipyrimidine photo-lyase